MRSVVFASLVLLAIVEPCGGAADPGSSGEPTRVRHPCTPTARVPAPASDRLTLARSIADRWLTAHPAETLEWNWTDGVLLASFVELHRATGDSRYLDYLRAYVDRQTRRGYVVDTSDHCLPAIAAVELWQSGCDAKDAVPPDTVVEYV